MSLMFHHGQFIRKPEGYWFWVLPPRPTMRAIAEDVAERRHIPIAKLIGPQRYKDYVRARQEAFYLIYQTGEFSLPQIGRFFGNRDHTTVLHGIRAHKARTETKAERRAA